MAQFKGTKGNWENQNGHIVCSTWPEIAYVFEFNKEANAKLVAAAPELLEALQELLDYPEEDLKSWSLGNEPIVCTFQPNHILKALTAIKKAIE